MIIAPALVARIAAPTWANSVPRVTPKGLAKCSKIFDIAPTGRATRLARNPHPTLFNETEAHDPASTHVHALRIPTCAQYSKAVWHAPLLHTTPPGLHTAR